MRPILLAFAVLALALPAFAQTLTQTPAQTPTALFVFVYRQGPAWKVGAPMREQTAMGAHGAYMKRLFETGVSFAAGPTTDAPGGIVIIRAASLDAAAAIMAQDPSVTSGMFKGELHAWTPAFRSDQPLPR